MLGAARTIYVDVGFPYTNFLGGHKLLNTSVELIHVTR